MQNSHFLCAKFCPARAVPYFQLTWGLEWSQQTAKRFNTTAGVQKLCYRRCSETIAPQVFRKYGTVRWFYRTVRCHSFWTPAVVLNRCAVPLNHNNARFSCKYRTARAGLNLAHKKVWSLHVFCTKWLSDHHHLTQGPKIIIWSHVLCQVHHPFNYTVVNPLEPVWAGGGFVRRN